MDLIVCKKIKQATKNGFNFLQASKLSKNRKVIFYKLKKIKNIDSILRDLSKAQKTFYLIF